MQIKSNWTELCLRFGML